MGQRKTQNETHREKIVISLAPAHFISLKNSLGKKEYNRLIQQAQQNNLQTYPRGIFYYRGEEKLRIFYYPKETGNS